MVTALWLKYKSECVSIEFTINLFVSSRPIVNFVVPSNEYLVYSFRVILFLFTHCVLCCFSPGCFALKSPISIILLMEFVYFVDVINSYSSSVSGILLFVRTSLYVHSYVVCWCLCGSCCGCCLVHVFGVLRSST